MDKRTILAVGLIILVIGAYNLLIIPKFAPPPTPAEQVAAPAVEATSAAPSAVQPIAAAVASAPGQAAVPAAPVEAAPPENIAIDRPLWAATFTNVGGGLVSWGLKTYTYAKGQTDAAGGAYRRHAARDRATGVGGAATVVHVCRPGDAGGLFRAHGGHENGGRIHADG